MYDFNMKNIVDRLSPTIVAWLEEASHMVIDGQYEEILVDDLIMVQMKSDNSMLVHCLRHSRIDVDHVWHLLSSLQRRRQKGVPDKPTFSRMLMHVLEQAYLISSLRYRRLNVCEASLTEAMIAYYIANPHPLSEILDGIDRTYLYELGRKTPSTPNEHGHVSAPPTDADGMFPWLTDFTLLAAQDELDPVFGRDDEIRGVIDILCRRRKNNPILVGEPGVGKTAIVEGLAIRIHEGHVPERLKHARLLQMDIGSLQAGASVKGEFERRIKDTLAYIEDIDEQVIMFVDEAHTLIGAGGDQGTGDASNLLKPALARGQLRMLAATTWAEYKQYIENDAALARRFQMVKVGEPDDESAVRMLTGISRRYQDYHGVHVSYDALEQAVKLSRRYISGRYLPDKAIDLLDTACARVSLMSCAYPQGINDITARISTLERRKQALEDDRKAGLDIDDARLASVDRELETLYERYKQEKDSGLPAGHIDDEAGDSDDSADRQYAQKKTGHCGDRQHNVTSDIIAKIVSEWTGVPASHMQCSELERFSTLEFSLSRNIIGQDKAIEIVSDSIRNTVSGLGSDESPMNVFLFFGPTGVGKTELARRIAETVHGGMRNLITLNMSEYQEAHSVSQLKGSPPGYVGYGKGGILTEAVRRMPYSVILLDEIEKAHRDIMDIFYQVFDKGFMRDGEGREIDFRHSIIIMTSNLGDEQLHDMYQDETSDMPDMETVHDRVKPVLGRHFPHALLARMTLVPFRPLDRQSLACVAARRLDELGQRLYTRHAIELQHDSKVAETIADLALSSMQGARMVNTIIDNRIKASISRSIIRQMSENSLCAGIVISATEAGLDIEFIDSVEHCRKVS